MKANLKKLAAILAFSATIFSCQKEKISPDVAKPVRKHIEAFNENAICNDAHVDEYKFQDKLVYVFEQGTCGADMTSTVENSDGKALGSLGGITGNTMINGENFSTATFIRTVWNKNS